MLSLIVSVFASLVIMFSAPVSAPIEASSQSTTQAVEAPSQALMVDAWQTIDDRAIHAPEDSPEMVLTYITTVDSYPESFGMGKFAVASIDLPNTYHVFKWDILRTM
jgi:hypothetical protein